VGGVGYNGLTVESRLLLGGLVVSITVEATYANGVLTPKQPLALPEGADVRLTIDPAHKDRDPLEAVIGIGDSGRTDGADNHDHYIYGVPKRP
jgi:predicted DNA-binding antitoxin AbrB/MazE fold protein